MSIAMIWDHLSLVLSALILAVAAGVPLGLLAYSLYEDGAFDTTKNSILILTAGINRFRRLEKGDMAEVEEMGRQNQETARRLEEERQSESGENN